MNEVSKIVVNYLDKLPKENYTNAKKFDVARILISDILTTVSYSNFERAGLLDLIKAEQLHTIERISTDEIIKILES
ncbi:MAG: hypothetical protein J0647_11795 [Campylobacteraceae bacterium]|nr:hypothetical protein [Campylobacteraceae bacterium]